MGLVIGLHGCKGAGKDHFYKVVKEKFPALDVRKVAYADPIKEEVLRIFNLSDEREYDQFKRVDVKFELYSNQWVKNIVSGRQVVREIGMLMRRYNPNQFVEYVEDKITQNPQTVWCITDLRFDNELRSVKDNLGGLIIKVKRSGFEYDGHITEREIPDHFCSSVIYNDGSIQEYEDKIVHTINSILETIKIN